MAKEVVEAFQLSMETISEALEAIQSSTNINKKLREDNIVNQTLTNYSLEANKNWLDDLENYKETLINETERANAELN